MAVAERSLPGARHWAWLQWPRPHRPRPEGRRPVPGTGHAVT